MRVVGRGCGEEEPLGGRTSREMEGGAGEVEGRGVGRWGGLAHVAGDGGAELLEVVERQLELRERLLHRLVPVHAWGSGRGTRREGRGGAPVRGLWRLWGDVGRCGEMWGDRAPASRRRR